jgi:hypothetical protein
MLKLESIAAFSAIAEVGSMRRTLKVLDVGAEAEGARVYIAYPEHLRSSGKIRALTESLRRSFGDPAYWEVDSHRDGSRR